MRRSNSTALLSGKKEATPEGPEWSVVALSDLWRATCPLNLTLGPNSEPKTKNSYFAGWVGYHSANNVLYLRPPHDWHPRFLLFNLYYPMKKTFSLVLSLFLVAFFVASCDDLTTIEIPFGITTEHQLAVNGTTSTLAMADTVDLTENADFNKHKNSIKECGVDSIAIRITDFFGSETQTITGAVSVGSLSDAALTTLYSIAEPLNLSQVQTATASGQWMTVTTTAEGRQKLADLIKNDPHQARLVLGGMSNQTPANFTAHFKIYWAMKATEELI
jgi:hypothetical protein